MKTHLTDLIISRRSIRKYKPESVEKEKILSVIKAAMYAPSAVNCQPWHFIVIDDRSVMKNIMAFHPSSKMLETASHAILVCGDENLQHDKNYWLADCGAATENLLLAAHSIGLGACWIGIFPRENRMKFISALMKLPPHIKPFALISLGYGDEKKDAPDRFKPERIYYNAWNIPF